MFSYGMLKKDAVGICEEGAGKRGEGEVLRPGKRKGSPKSVYLQGRQVPSLKKKTSMNFVERLEGGPVQKKTSVF